MYTYRLVLLLVFILFMFSPIIMDWWLDSIAGWYRPLIFWFGVVLVAVCLEEWQEADDL